MSLFISYFNILGIFLFDDLHLNTLVRLIMTGNIVAGKNNGGYKYGGFAEKPPDLTRHYFTCYIIFTKKICKSTEFYLPYCKILYHSTVSVSSTLIEVVLVRQFQPNYLISLVRNHLAMVGIPKK